jgi:hypothetical protein
MRGPEQPLTAILGADVHRFRPVDGAAPSVLRVTRPVLDASGSHALLLYSRFFQHQFGGREELVFLTKASSGWRKTGWRVLGQT